jgi:hypothetical protein
VETKEYITADVNNKEDWHCKCGNRSDNHGFFPCDSLGNEMEPTIGSAWDNLYVCGKCGRIINQDTLKVMGRNENFKRLP